MADPDYAELAIVQAGIILFVARYDECVAFYRTALGLSVVWESEALTIFAFGDGYLEVERGGPAADGIKPRDRNPTVLRFDVVDLDRAVAALERAGVSTERFDFDWGSIAVFTDPDGNRCELKRHDAAQTVTLRRRDG